MDQEKPQSRFRQTVAAVMALVTLWGTVVGFLSTDASIRESLAIRDNEVLAIEVMPALSEASARVGYDGGVMGNWMMLKIDEGVNQALAVTLQGKAGEDLLQRYDLEGRLQSQVAAAMVLESTWLSDPRYVRSLESDEIETTAYVQDQYRRAIDLVEGQNAADEAYTSAPTLLAVVSLIDVGWTLALLLG